MWIEFVIIFLCAYFISSHVAKYFAFRVVKPGDRPIFIIFTIQIFTVVCQVALARLIFRKIFIRESHKHVEFDELQREDEEIVELS